MSVKLPDCEGAWAGAVYNHEITLFTNEFRIQSDLRMFDLPVREFVNCLIQVSSALTAPG
jgi:hypothetical protein